jgi:hypothetical protein
MTKITNINKTKIYINEYTYVFLLQSSITYVYTG